MVLAGRIVVTLALAGLFAGPIYADVIPTQQAPKSEAKNSVESRLVQLGQSPESAKTCVARLTEQEAKFFARDLSRVQVVGQEMWGGQADPLWWELVFGGVFLVGSLLVIYSFVSDGSA